MLKILLKIIVMYFLIAFLILWASEFYEAKDKMKNDMILQIRTIICQIPKTVRFIIYLCWPLCLIVLIWLCLPNRKE